MNLRILLTFGLGCLGFSLSAATNSPPANTAEPTKTCFQCKGAGKMKCAAPGCKEGQTDCPGKCIKASGPWIHLNVPGHNPIEKWQRFYYADGRRYNAWTEAHIGQVVEMKNGEPVIGPSCTLCGGTSRVLCKVCKGTGEVVCSLCDGKKTIPVSWSTFDNPKMKDRPTRFTMKDGRVIVGRRKMAMDDRVMIRTETGDVTINTADIASEEKPSSR